MDSLKELQKTKRKESELNNIKSQINGLETRLKYSINDRDNTVCNNNNNVFIPGGPEITEQSIQSIFQDFALINSYFLHLVG